MSTKLFPNAVGALTVAQLAHFLIFPSLTTCKGELLIPYSFSFPSNFGLNEVQLGPTQSFYAGALLSSFFTLRLTRSMGRREIFGLGDLVIVVACIAMIPWGTFFNFLVGRFMQGIGMGITAPLGFIYVKESCPQESRGKFGMLAAIVFAVSTLISLLWDLIPMSMPSQTPTWITVLEFPVLYSLQRCWLLGENETPYFLVKKKKVHELEVAFPQSSTSELKKKIQSLAEEIALDENKDNQLKSANIRLLSFLLGINFGLSGLLVFYTFGTSRVANPEAGCDSSSLVSLNLRAILYAVALVGSTIINSIFFRNKSRKYPTTLGLILIFGSFLGYGLGAPPSNSEFWCLNNNVTEIDVIIPLIIIWNLGFGLFLVGKFCYCMEAFSNNDWDRFFRTFWTVGICGSILADVLIGSTGEEYYLLAYLCAILDIPCVLLIIFSLEDTYNKSKKEIAALHKPLDLLINSEVLWLAFFILFVLFYWLIFVYGTMSKNLMVSLFCL